jgi:hypothetical protein
MKRWPAAAGAPIARMCRSATSRTSAMPKRCRGATLISPLNIALTRYIEEPVSSVSGGPSMNVGLTTTSSVPPPSSRMKSQAARSAIVLERG